MDKQSEKRKKKHQIPRRIADLNLKNTVENKNHAPIGRQDDTGYSNLHGANNQTPVIAKARQHSGSLEERYYLMESDLTAQDLASLENKQVYKNKLCVEKLEKGKEDVQKEEKDDLNLEEDMTIGEEDMFVNINGTKRKQHSYNNVDSFNTEDPENTDMDTAEEEIQHESNVNVSKQDYKQEIDANSAKTVEKPEIGIDGDKNDGTQKIYVDADDIDEEYDICKQADKHGENQYSGEDADKKNRQQKNGEDAYKTNEQQNTCEAANNRDDTQDVSEDTDDNREENKGINVKAADKEVEQDICLNADTKYENRYIDVDANNRVENRNIYMNAADKDAKQKIRKDEDAKEEKHDNHMNANKKDETKDVNVNAETVEAKTESNILSENKAEQLNNGVNVLHIDDIQHIGLSVDEQNEQQQENLIDSYDREGNLKICIDADKGHEEQNMYVHAANTDCTQEIGVNAEDTHDNNINEYMKDTNRGCSGDAENQEEIAEISLVANTKDETQDIVVNATNKHEKTVIVVQIAEKEGMVFNIEKEYAAKDIGVVTGMTKSKKDVDAHMGDEKRNDDVIADQTNEKHKLDVNAVKNVKKHEIDMTVDKEEGKWKIGLAFVNKEDTQEIVEYTEKKDKREDICFDENKTDDKHDNGFGTVQQFKNTNVGEGADDGENKEITHIDDVNTVTKHDINMVSSTKETMSTFMWLINQFCEFFCRLPKKNTTSLSARNVNVDAADKDINAGSDVDAFNRELDQSSNTKLFTNTDEVTPQDTMQTKNVNRCKDVTTIKRIRDVSKYFNDILADCGAIVEVIGKFKDDEEVTSSFTDRLTDMEDFVEKHQLNGFVPDGNTFCVASRPKGEFTKVFVLIQVEELVYVLNSSRSKDQSRQASPLRKKTKYIPGKTGLNNKGNRCYMNSTLQCLNNTSPLVDYFRNGKYKDDSNDRRGQLVDEFADLVNKMWSGKEKCISPERLKNEIGQYHQRFAGSQQEDSQEFLTSLLNELNEGLKKVNQEQGNQTLAICRPEHKLHTDSIVEELFQGQFKKTIICRTCNKQTESSQAFMYLFLPIPNQTSCTLHECLDLYFAERRVTGNCLMPSPNCRERSDTVVKLEIMKLPRILIIALKRFANEGYKWTKNDAYVDFPMREMDLPRFVIDPPQMKYDLYAVSNHNGSLASGHYTAFCRNRSDQNWYKFNDADVVVFPPEVEELERSVKTSAAYVLYYESVDQSISTPRNSSSNKSFDE